jgi:hypothetical protein
MPKKAVKKKAARKQKATQKKLPIQFDLGPPLGLPDGTPLSIDPRALLLDPQNLRLLERVHAEIRDVKAKLIGEAAVQNKVFQIMWGDDSFDVPSLETSITQNGFLRHENLIVAPFSADKFLVLEGNRRLTAVKHIFEQYGSELDQLPPYVKRSLQTLPCFVLDGPVISGDDELLEQYRRAAEIYIGMRHLMGPKRWEPASRYEFQARLILEENWKPADVAERFGRTKNEVIRDLKAQRLYRDFRTFEQKLKIGHSLTYNAFAEAARAPAIMTWLGWSNDRMEITNKKREESFFHYVIARLRARARVGLEEGEEEMPDESAEKIVRQLKDMLKLKDPSIEAALEDREFDSAELLFREKRQGDFSKRILAYINGLKRVTTEELTERARENKTHLNQLIEQAQKIIKLLDALLKR